MDDELDITEKFMWLTLLKLRMREHTCPEDRKPIANREAYTYADAVAIGSVHKWEERRRWQCLPGACDLINAPGRFNKR